MRKEMPEISFKEMLMVPDGPPESVWERALDAAYAAAEDDAAPDDPSPDSDEPEAQGSDLLASGTDEDPDATAHHDSMSPTWAEGLGPDHADGSHGDGMPHGGDGPDYGSDVSDGIPSSGDEAGY